jgi:hypothetical protein
MDLKRSIIKRSSSSFGLRVKQVGVVVEAVGDSLSSGF